MLQDLVRRSLWLAFGAAAGRLMPLAVLLMLSRQVEARQFASASAAYAWAGVAMSLTSAGLATVMTQRMGAAADAPTQARLFMHHLRLSLAWAGLLAGLVLAFGEQGGARLFGVGLDPVVIVPAALSGALWSQVAVCVAALNGSHQARAASSTLASCGLLQGLGMVAAVLAFGASAQSAVWGLLAGNALACVVAAFLIRRALGWPGGHGQLRYSDLGVPRVAGWHNPVLWNTIAAASALPASFLAGSLIAHGDHGVRQLAQYFALEQVHQLLVYLPAIVGQALLPLISRSIGRAETSSQHGRVLRSMALAAGVAALAGLVAGAVLVIDVHWLIRLLANPALGDGDAWAVRWMVMNAALSLCLTIIGGAVVGSGRMVGGALMNLGWGAAFVGLTWALADQGNQGLQAARLAATATLALLSLWWLLAQAARETRAGDATR